MYKSNNVYIPVEEKFEIDEKDSPIEKWSHSETLALLHSYNLHRKDFQEFKLKQMVWEVIQKDLAEQGIYKSCLHISNKWKNLIRTYKNVKQSGREGKKIRFQYMRVMSNIMENNFLMETPPDGTNYIELKDPFAETMELNEDQNITIEFSEDNLDDLKGYIEDNGETQTSTGDISKNTVVALKTKYLQEKIAEIRYRRQERKQYLDMIREAKLLKRKRDEHKLQLKEKELEIEERKVSALEQYLALKKQP